MSKKLEELEKVISYKKNDAHLVAKNMQKDLN